MVSNGVLELEYIYTYGRHRSIDRFGLDMTIHKNKGIFEKEIDDKFIILSKLMVTLKKRYA